MVALAVSPSGTWRNSDRLDSVISRFMIRRFVHGIASIASAGDLVRGALSGNREGRDLGVDECAIVDSQLIEVTCEVAEHGAVVIIRTDRSRSCPSRAPGAPSPLRPTRSSVISSPMIELRPFANRDHDAVSLAPRLPLHTAAPPSSAIEILTVLTPAANVNPASSRLST